MVLLRGSLDTNLRVLDWSYVRTVLWIRIANPDPDFKSPDLSVFCFSLSVFNKLNGSK